MILFGFKKIVSLFVMPLGLGLVLSLCGLVLAGLARKRRPGLALAGLGLGLVYLGAINPVANDLAARLEYLLPLPAPERLAQAEFIVVLGGGMLPGRREPADRLTQGSIARAVKGVQLAKSLPGARVIFSGFEARWRGSEAAAMAELAKSLGLAGGRVILEEKSMDTAQQAANIAPLVGPAPFALVTSAVHLPRATALFAGQGLTPIPVPANYLSIQDAVYDRLIDFLPRASNVLKLDQAAHEYLGLAWARMRGQL